MAYEKFVGKWALAETDNFDKYLGEIGIGWTQRTAAKVIKPVLTFEVSNEGNHWKFTSVSTFKTHATEFDLDNEFEEETIDGRKMLSKFTFVDGKLLQTQNKIDPKDKDSYFERYIESVDGKDDVLVIMCRSGEVTAVRKYHKQ